MALGGGRMSVQPAIRKLTLNLPQSLAVSTGRVLSKFTLYWVVVSQNHVLRAVEIYKAVNYGYLWVGGGHFGLVGVETRVALAPASISSCFDLK
jgi:hypothetical protein